jgi:ABC-type multidrug transport system fused ATPase/permease subunit
LNADKIVVMENGRITAIGEHKELLKNSLVYKRLYDMQFGQRTESEDYDL